MPVIHYTCDQLPDEALTMIVLGIRCQGKWLFVPVEDGTGWCLPLENRREGEPLSATAQRCACRWAAPDGAKIIPVSAFQDGDRKGMLYFIEIINASPSANGCLLQDTLPEELACPGRNKALYDRLQGWCNVQTSADELWNVLDENRQPTGRVHRRGDPMPAGDFHLTVHVWLRDSKGRFLITKRAPNKGYANLWECTGGSALAGDDSLTAAVREVQEETGLSVDPAKGRCILQRKAWDWFNDVWLFEQNFDLKDVVLQPGETTEAKAATTAEILQMDARGEMVPFAYLRDFLKEYGK